MIFSQTVEYALRTVVWLASQGGMPRTTSQIAEATRVPPGYLAKILQSLGRAGLVSSRRGVRGGFTLTASPEKVTPLDVIAVIDPIRRITTCPLGIDSHSDTLCPLHQRLDNAIALIQRQLGETSISELLNTPSDSTPFCK